jgi:CheY-like chemotaxis protein
MTTTNRGILLVEDNEDDVFLMRRALQAAHVVNPLFVVDDGQEAVDYLGRNGKYASRDDFQVPAIVFLDLKLPYMSGHDVLAWIRDQKQLESLIVIVLTSSNEPSDLARAYSLGANSYVVKPPTPDQLEAMAKAFKWYWLEYNQFDQSSHT